jgi:hypothetical protein
LGRYLGFASCLALVGSIPAVERIEVATFLECLQPFALKFDAANDDPHPAPGAHAPIAGRRTPGVTRHGLDVTRHGLGHQWPHRHRDASRSCPDHRGHKAGYTGPSVVMPLLAGDMEAAVDIAHFEHLIAQNHPLAAPRA